MLQIDCKLTSTFTLTLTLTLTPKNAMQHHSLLFVRTCDDANLFI